MATLAFRIVFSALLLVLFLTSCAGVQPGESSVNTRINECSKIADRAERERCIEAAYQAD